MSAELPEPIIENPEQKPDETPIIAPPTVDQDEVKRKNRKEFWLGVGLWFLLNLIVTPLCDMAVFFVISFITTAAGVNSYEPVSQNVSTLASIILGFVPFVVNIGLIVYFIWAKRTQVALGMLTAFSVVLLLVLLAGVLTSVGCFVLAFSSSSSDGAGYAFIGQIIVAAATAPVFFTLVVMAVIFFVVYRYNRDAFSLRMTKVISILLAVTFVISVVLTIAYLVAVPN